LSPKERPVNLNKNTSKANSFSNKKLFLQIVKTVFAKSSAFYKAAAGVE